MITFNELCDLEDMVSACAESALRLARLGTGKDTNTDSLKITDETIDKLMECYSRSAFSVRSYEAIEDSNLTNGGASEPKEHTRLQNYYKYIRHNFLEATEAYRQNCKSQRHLDLVLPVLFFSLILQNESHAESVSRRALKIDLEGVHSTPWKYRNPFKLTGHRITPNPKRNDQFQKTVLSLEPPAIYHDIYKHPMLSPEITKAINGSLRISGEYDKIMFFSEHARIGSFLADILEKMHDSKHPLDTILRMYMVKQMHNIFEWSRFWYSKNPIHEYEHAETGLLLRFFVEEGASREEAMLWGKLPLFYIGNGAGPDTRKILDRKLKQKDQFSTYYLYLNRNFDWEINGFVEYFLNNNVLKKYINADKVIIKYVKAMKHFIKEMPKLEGAYYGVGIISELDYFFAQMY